MVEHEIKSSKGLLNASHFKKVIQSACNFFAWLKVNRVVGVAMYVYYPPFRKFFNYTTKWDKPLTSDITHKRIIRKFILITSIIINVFNSLEGSFIG